MALIIETSIICDKCARQFNTIRSTLTGMQLRKLASTYGWVYHGKDVCADCRVKEKNGKDFKHSKNRQRRNNAK